MPYIPCSFTACGYPIITVNGRYYVIETASPVSYSFEPNSFLTLNGVVYYLQEASSAGKKYTESMVAYSVIHKSADGILGRDILKKAHYKGVLKNQPIAVFDSPGPETAALPAKPARAA